MATLQILLFVVAFASAAMFVWAIGLMTSTTDSVQRRLVDDRVERGGRRSLLRGTDGNPLVQALLRPFQRFTEPEENGVVSGLRLKLMQAGFFNSNAPAAFMAIRTAMAFGFLTTATLLIPLLGGKFPRLEVLFGVMAIGVLGYFLPQLVVARLIARRLRSIKESFPDALDMMLMCVEAGVGLSEAIARVGDELDQGNSILGKHFKLLSDELRAGKTREHAFRSFSTRIGVDEIRAFVSLLMQTEELGTSMAATLRSMTDDMRQGRMLRAEEIAQKLSTKLSVVVMLFVLPVLLVVIVAPAAISAKHQFEAVRH